MHRLSAHFLLSLCSEVRGEAGGGGAPRPASISAAASRRVAVTAVPPLWLLSEAPPPQTHRHVCGFLPRPPHPTPLPSGVNYVSSEANSRGVFRGRLGRISCAKCIFKPVCFQSSMARRGGERVRAADRRTSSNAPSVYLCSHAGEFHHSWAQTRLRTGV